MFSSLSLLPEPRCNEVAILYHFRVSAELGVGIEPMLLQRRLVDGIYPLFGELADRCVLLIRNAARLIARDAPIQPMVDTPLGFPGNVQGFPALGDRWSADRIGGRPAALISRPVWAMSRSVSPPRLVIAAHRRWYQNECDLVLRRFWRLPDLVLG